jgi:uncharacterized protein (UPF0548 family)
VFTLSRPTADAIRQQIASATELPATAPRLLSLRDGIIAGERLPFGFAHDISRSHLGVGVAAFATARAAFTQWITFDLGWVRVANPEAPIMRGQVVAVEAHTLGLWTLNLSRIVETVESETQFGFLYATTALHVEEGEESFLLEFDPSNGDVWYAVEAVSRPKAALSRLGFPITRAFQHRFARDSHRRMREAVLALSVSS